MKELKKVFAKKFWIHVAFFVAAVAVILYFVPGRAHKKFVYEVGKPWTAPALYAPAQLVVGLDAASEKAIKDSIINSFIPFFKHNTNIEAEIQSKISRTPMLMHREISNAVRQVYADGIVDNRVYDSIQNNKLPSLKVVDNENRAQTLSTAKMRSAKAAYEYIDKQVHGVLSMSTLNLAELLKPNYAEDSQRNKEYLQGEYARASIRAPIEKGELIIARGAKVTPQNALAIEACEKILESESTGKSHYPIVGNTIVVLMLFFLLFLYFLIYRRQAILENKRKLSFVLSLLTAVTIASYTLMHRVVYGPMLMPITLIPVIVVTFFDSRTAFFLSIVQVLLCSLIEEGAAQGNFIIMHTVACIVAIDTLQELTKRSQLIRTAICVFLSYSIMYVAMTIIEEGNITAIDLHTFACFAINAVMLSFAYVIIFVFERVFGFVSKVTLVELADINNPLLQELSEKCPGTFQHSVQLSNLVAEAAREIGANSQLARAGALYHDIGKMDNPAFFTENQHDVNPHEVLTPEQSAKIVIRHVTDGLKRAEKEKLPMEIRNFILEHHGRNLAKYFYTTACNNNGGNPVDPTPFTYPGPNPRSKETSLLMMADATEAASRSLKEYNDETISNLVNKIIDGQIAQGLMKDSPLSFRDVEVVKKVFISRLRTMYHTRISYPELKKPASKPTQ